MYSKLREYDNVHILQISWIANSELTCINKPQAMKKYMLGKANPFLLYFLNVLQQMSVHRAWKLNRIYHKLFHPEYLHNEFLSKL